MGNQQQQFVRELSGALSGAADSWRAYGESWESDAEFLLLAMDDMRRAGDEDTARMLEEFAFECCEQVAVAERHTAEFEYAYEHARFVRVRVPGVGIPRSRSRCSTRSRERRSTRSCARSGDSGDDGDGEHEPATHRAGGAS